MIGTGMSLVQERPQFVEEPSRLRVATPAGSEFLARAILTVDENAQIVNVEQDFERRDFLPRTTERVFGELIERAKARIDRYPDSHQAWRSLGSIYLNAGRLDEASDAFGAALDREPDDLPSTVRLGVVRIQQQRLAEAETLLRRAVQRFPKEPSPRMLLADIATRRQDFPTAVSLWREIVALRPTAPLPQYFLGCALLSGEPDQRREAIAYLRKAARREVRFAPFHHGLGVAYMVTGQASRAERAFRTALTLQPLMPEALQGLAAALLQQGRDEDTMAFLQDYSEKNATDYQARSLLADVYFKRRRIADARQTLFQILGLIQESPVISVDTQSRITNNLGVCYALERDLEQAKQLFNRAIELAPTQSPVSYVNLCRLFLQTRRYREAQNTAEECLREFPDHTEIALMLAWAHADQGHYTIAIEQLRPLLGRTNAPASAYASLGGLLVDETQNLHEALAVLREGYHRFPDSREIANNLAYAQLMVGDVAAARDTLARVPPVADDAVALMATRGLLHLLEGDMERGVAGYRDAERAARRQGDADLASEVRQKLHLEVAKYYLRNGDRNAAAKEVRAAIASRRTRSVIPYRRDLRDAASHLGIALDTDDLKKAE